MTLSGPDTQRPLLREWIQGDWGVRMWHRRCQSWVGGAVHESKSVYVCESRGREGGRRGDSGRLSMVLTPPGGAEWSYFQAPVHLLPWQQQWPRCCHGEVDTKRRGVGTGPGVRSEGQGVKGHSQLDSTQEEARVRKEGGKVWFSFSFSPFLLQVSAREGDVRQVDTTGH